MTKRSVGAPTTRARRLVRAVVCGIVASAVVTALAFLVRVQFDPLLDADEAAIRWSTDVTRSHPGLRTALLVWQEITQPLHGYLVASALCLWLWLRRGQTTRAWWAFITMMVGWNLALDLKYLVARARPVVADPVSHAPGYSFPSGHAANATILAIAVTILLWPSLGSVARRVAVVLATVYTVLTGLDRVFLGVHFPSDVIGGVLLGTGLVGASYFGYRGWNPAPPPQRKVAP